MLIIAEIYVSCMEVGEKRHVSIWHLLEHCLPESIANTDKYRAHNKNEMLE